MSLSKLTKLRDAYADKVKAHQDATQSNDKTSMTKAKRTMKAAGKSYLKAIYAAAETHSKTDVWDVILPG
jgi:hypothetical protein